jgi:hypothetical protein
MHVRVTLHVDMTTSGTHNKDRKKSVTESEYSIWCGWVGAWRGVVPVIVHRVYSAQTMCVCVCARACVCVSEFVCV